MITKTCLWRWKEERVEERQVWDSKAPQTQHWTQDRDWTLGDPSTDMGGSAKPCWRSCWHVSVAASVTANSRSVYSGSFKHFRYQAEKLAIWKDTVDNLYPVFLLFLVTLGCSLTSQRDAKLVYLGWFGGLDVVLRGFLMDVASRSAVLHLAMSKLATC